MTDTRQDRQDPTGTSNFAPIIGFALGALVGAGLALLMAPASGERTRRRLGNAARRMSRDARRMSRDARHTFEDARETVSGAASGLGADVKSALDAGREAFRDGKPHDAHPASRIAQTPNPPPTRITP